MKKKLLIIILMVFVLIAGIIIWYNIPSRLCRYDSKDIQKITVFNGNTGDEVTINDKNKITSVINKFNSVKIKKDGISLFRMGYLYRVTIFSESGTKQFILNSKTVIRKDPFYYEVVSGDSGFSIIEELFNK